MDMDSKVFRGALVGLLWFILAVVIESAPIDDDTKLQFEAAFQGQCGHSSPCEQLCYELHDGMYECDCKHDYVLREDGYSCAELNASSLPSDPEKTDQQPSIVLLNNYLYQKATEMDAMEFLDSSIENVTVKQKTIDSNQVYSDNISDGLVAVSTGQLGRRGTTQGPSLEQKLTVVSGNQPRATLPISTEKPCTLRCGDSGGLCVRRIGSSDDQTCLCPLGKKGVNCSTDVQIQSPRFTGLSWLAFTTLRGAYKHVQLSLELRPEAYDGIFFLTGERDDMAGDFMALLLHQGFVEFRFDCGSGVGIVRSEETVLLNQWNHITLYRHRWDAWLQLNGGKHVQGRSKGLFSRITFREPLFIGGAGNTTGLSSKLPVTTGLKGCIRHLEVNDHIYKFALEPYGEATKGFGIEECTADRCSKVPCQHGGKCLTSGQETAVCLCPLGFSGDLCEIRVDLQVPAFNGSSHLRYRGLKDEALTWLELEVVIKPTALNGIILYNGHGRIDGYGRDFIALYLNDGKVEFSYDLGTGAAVAISKYRINLGEWHKIYVSRTGRQAVLIVDNQQSIEVLSPGAFTQLSLPKNLYIGGVPNNAEISTNLRIQTSMVGCIQSVKINGRPMAILAEALSGANVDNCPHPCVAKPCGEDGYCIPDMDYFTCRCRPGYRDHQCAPRGPPSFNGKDDSYLYFNDAKTLDTLLSDPLTLNIRFKTSSSNGILLWSNDGAGGSFMSIGVEGGYLVLRFIIGDEEVVVVHNTTTVHDKLWHRIKAVRDGRSALLVVDNGPAITHQFVKIIRHRETPGSEEEGLYVGGMPHHSLAQYTKYKSGIEGCVADIVINTDYHLQLISHLMDNAHNIGECES